MQFCRSSGITSLAKSTFAGASADNLNVRSDKPKPAPNVTDLATLSLRLTENWILEVPWENNEFIGSVLRVI